MLKNKSQLAMETVMIYTISLLIAASAIGVLIYFDVINPSSLLPDRCNIDTADLTCFQYSVIKSSAGAKVSLELTNNMDFDMEIIKISISGKDEEVWTNDYRPCETIKKISIASESTQLVNIDNCYINIPSGKKIKGKINIEYNEVDSLVTRKTSGEISTFVQSGCVPSQELCNGKDDNCNDKIDEDLTRQCSNINEYGTCYGDEICDEEEWVNCNALSASEEICDNQDNDCDGYTDENLECCEPVPEICSDSTDNDCDILIDCSDPDCEGEICNPGNICSSGNCIKITEICDDGIDNNNDLESDYDSKDGMHGDADCAVGITAVSVSNPAPTANTNIDVLCASTAGNINSVNAYIGSSQCNGDSPGSSWNGNTYTFKNCNVGSTGIKPVKCSIDTSKSYVLPGQEEKITDINIQPACECTSGTCCDGCHYKTGEQGLSACRYCSGTSNNPANFAVDTKDNEGTNKCDGSAQYCDGTGVCRTMTMVYLEPWDGRCTPSGTKVKCKPSTLYHTSLTISGQTVNPDDSWHDSDTSACGSPAIPIDKWKCFYCDCSGTSCEPGNTGRICKDCKYVNAPGEICNDLDDNCNGLIDDGIQCCGWYLECPATKPIVVSTQVISGEEYYGKIRYPDNSLFQPDYFNVDDIYMGFFPCGVNLGNALAYCQYAFPSSTAANPIYYTQMTGILRSTCDYGGGQVSAYYYNCITPEVIQKQCCNS